MNQQLNREMFERAKRSIPGGVNSPVRSFARVGGDPVFVGRADGPFIYDVSENRYVDYVMSWGVHILGHCHPRIVEAIRHAAARGTSFGMCTQAEIELAELIKQAFPSVELVRLVNSGTEAVMSAVRLARGFTGRAKVIAFEGCYHGHSDGLLVKAGSGLATLGIPASAGVPQSIVGETLLAHYNDLASVEALVAAFPDDVACILVEPVAGNMGVVPPHDGFLEGVRTIADRIGALLIFDEVITGFRLSFGGAQQRYGVKPDMTCLGKIIGGGLPIGAFGGPRSVMERLAPLGDVYQAGTLSGNPIAVAAGIAALKTLHDDPPYELLEKRGAYLEQALANAAGIPIQISRVGSMFSVFFTGELVTDYASASATDGTTYARWFRELLDSGVLIPPSPLESCFVSTAHDDSVLEETAQAFAMAFASLAS